jgi:hypothetical protein
MPVIPGVVQQGAFTADTVQKALMSAFVQLSGIADALDGSTPNRYAIITAGVDAVTLNAPIAGINDGYEILIISTTANAHTVTSTGNLQTGTAGVNKATFPAQAGAAIWLVAFNGKWVVSGVNGAVVFS